MYKKTPVTMGGAKRNVSTVRELGKPITTGAISQNIVKVRKLIKHDPRKEESPMKETQDKICPKHIGWDALTTTSTQSMEIESTKEQ